MSVATKSASQGSSRDMARALSSAAYSSEEFAELAVWCRALVDRVAAGLPGDTLRRMEDAFLTSSRYEYMFWEMAWRQERWPA